MTDDGEGTGSFIKTHPTLLIGFVIVGALILGAAIFKKNQATGTTTQDLSGLGTNSQGQPVVYVPTSTNFSTSNIGAQFANDPNLQTISTGAITTNSPITATQSTSTTNTNTKPSVAPVIIAPAKPVVSVPATPPPVNPPPPSGGTVTGGVQPVKLPPVPAPPSKGIKWNYPYTIRGGDTLSAIANNITNAARAAGAPSNTVITYQQIYNFNKAVIDATANAHGNPVPGGAANNIFPGENIILATWS